MQASYALSPAKTNPPMVCHAKITGGAAPDWIGEVHVVDPVEAAAWMEDVPITDLNNTLALSASDWITVILYFPVELKGGCRAYVAQG